MMNGTGVEPTREPFISAKLKLWHAREFWDFIGEKFQDHARHLKIKFEIHPVAGSSRRAVWAIPSPILEYVTTMAVGDALHALSCALDHLVYELFEIYGGDTSKARMPVTKKRSDVQKFLDDHGKKLPQAIRDFILDEVKPYRDGGDHDIWAVRQLDNVDKHRLIVPYAAAAIVPVGLMRVGNVGFEGANFIINAINPHLVYWASDTDDLTIWNQSDVEEISYLFHEQDIFDSDQPIGEFFVRAGSRIAVLIGGLADLVYGQATRPRFDGHQGWRDHQIPKPARSIKGIDGSSMLRQLPATMNGPLLEGEAEPSGSKTPLVDRWLRQQGRE